MPKHVDPPRFIRLSQVVEMTGLAESGEMDPECVGGKNQFVVECWDVDH